jgi:hypothetical protein
MPARERQKGHEAERAVANYFASSGWPMAITQRNSVGGNYYQQREDIVGVPGVSIEVKNRYRFEPASALRQAAINGGPDKVALLIVKPNGVGLTRVGDWWAMCYLRHLVPLLPREGPL